MMTTTRWTLALAGLAVAVSVGLLLFPFSSSNGPCGSAAFPRYNRDLDVRLCGDETYDGRRKAAGVLLLGGLSAAAATTARRSARRG
jgi:hypothetical protein